MGCAVGAVVGRSAGGEGGGRVASRPGLLLLLLLPEAGVYVSTSTVDARDVLDTVGVAVLGCVDPSLGLAASEGVAVGAGPATGL